MMRDDLTDNPQNREVQPRLILISHQPTKAERLENQLIQLGYAVESFVDGEWAIASRKLPDLILIQSDCPYYWQQVDQRLKSDPKTYSVPLIVFTQGEVALNRVQSLARQGLRLVCSSNLADLVSAIEGQLAYTHLRSQYREESDYILPSTECYVWQQPIAASASSERLLSDNSFLLGLQQIAHFGSWEWQRQQDNTLTQEILGSQESYRILGLAPQRLTYTQILKRVHSKYRREFHNRIQEAIAEGVPQDWEISLYSGDYRGDRQERHLRYCELRVQPILGRDGMVKGLFGIVFDISDRKLLEQKIQTSEMEMRSVFGAMGDIVLVLDRAGETIKMIPTAPALGEGVEQISETINQIIYGEQRETLCEQLQQVVSQQITLTFDYALEMEDSKLWFSATLSPMPEDQVIWIARNITQRKHVELERDLALEQAQKANRAKSQFLANMSHELRTPLNGILGFTQVLLRDEFLSPDYQRALNTIYHSGEHLLGLINNILDLSKVEAGYIHINSTPINLEVFLDTLHQMLNLKAEEKQLKFEVEKITEFPQGIQTDEGKLRQILINLIGNAIKFTSRGQVILRVGYLEREDKLPLLTFEVEDTGPGIPPAELELLFQPFQQTSSGLASQEGTGLGLSISHKFVELLGGELTVSSQVNQGSVFKFQIPVELEYLPQIAGYQEYRQVKGLAPNQPSYRILVVEDRLDDRQWLVQLLEMVGFEVESAADGQKAIAQWQNFHPHLILMDLRMPNQSGYPTIEQMRAMSQGESIPIIAMTAMVFENEEQLNAQISYDRLLYKPLQGSILFSTIADFLPLEYTYKDSLAMSLLSKPINPETVDLSVLQTMPEPWLAEMYYATITLDDQRILELIQDLPADRVETIEFIKQKLNGFDFESLLDRLTPLLPESARYSQTSKE